MTRVYLPRSAASERALDRLEQRLQMDLPVIPGVDLEVGDMRSRHRRGTQRRRGTVRVALRGEDPEFLESLGRDVEDRLRLLDDVHEVYGPTIEGRQEARVLIDPERARSLGVEPQRIAEAVSFAFRGQRMRRFQGPRGEIEVLLGLPEQERPGLGALADLPIPRPGAEPVPLSAVAEIRESRTPPNIVRIDRKTTSWVTVEFEEGLITEQAKSRVERVMRGFTLPEGYDWDWGQEHRHEDEALGVMFRGLGISLCVVLLMMAALFESLTQPLAILITLPLAAFGSFWLLWLLGFVLDPIVIIGLIILVGIVVNNGIVMVDHVNSLRREGHSREAALVRGCGDRLRPVLMTAITTVFGLIPLSLSQFTVAGVYVDSMAVAMMGGLISSTVFTLVALPVWYTTIEDLGCLLAGLLPAHVVPERLRVPRARVLLPPGDDSR